MRPLLPRNLIERSHISRHCGGRNAKFDGECIWRLEAEGIGVQVARGIGLCDDGVKRENRVRWYVMVVY